LVDDEKPARDRLRHLLSDHPEVSVVGEAGDGEEALALIRSTRPDVVLLDIQMPGKSGMQVASQLEPPRPKIVFCTAFDQYAIKAFELSAVDYLLKPVNRTRLFSTIDRVLEEKAERGASQSDIQEASDVQQRLQGKREVGLGALECVGCCYPALRIAGDYYDFITLKEDLFGVTLADVSGKGVYAGLLMANLQGRLQSRAPAFGNQAGDLIADVNRLMWDSTEASKYATLFYAVFDNSRKSLTYVNAGHPPPLVVRSDSECEVIELHEGGTAIGLFPDSVYGQGEIRLGVGDLVLIYSDGVTEAENREGEEFGRERLAELARSGSTLDLGRLESRILDAVAEFRDGVGQQDDVTVVLLRVAEHSD